MTAGKEGDNWKPIARLSRHAMSERSGCQAKVPGCELEALLGDALEMVFGFSPPPNPMVNPQDAALLTTLEKTLLVSNDFAPAVGTDPFAAGRIAALHAMNDIFARGGSPGWALTTVLFGNDYDQDSRRGLLAGIWYAAKSESVEICGGQTVEGHETMVGLTVIGTVCGANPLGKQGGRTGDCLCISKPIGVGMVTRAYRAGWASDEELDVAVSLMTTSNRATARAALAAGVRAATDVSGFGLLGHLSEMLAPGQGAEIDCKRIPYLAPITRLATKLLPTRWSDGNLEYVQSRRIVRGNKDPRVLFPLLDPQTNGGLLVAAPDDTVRLLEEEGFTRIGSITDTDTIDLIE